MNCKSLGLAAMSVLGGSILGAIVFHHSHFGLRCHCRQWLAREMNHFRAAPQPSCPRGDMLKHSDRQQFWQGLGQLLPRAASSGAAAEARRAAKSQKFQPRWILSSRPINCRGHGTCPGSGCMNLGMDWGLLPLPRVKARGRHQ